jgi:hypothetical protein
MTSNSVILIDEKVIDDDDHFARGYTSALSLNMYCNFHGLERKRRQWLKLLGRAGFSVKDITTYSTFGDAIIAAVPAYVD